MNEFYLIRHAHALKREKWDKDDLKRPLEKEKIALARKFFTKVFKNLPKPKIIYTSEAKRAMDTAKILQKITEAEIIIEKGLNPGSDTQGYLSVVKSHTDATIFAIIGHEPDMTKFISSYVGESRLNIRLKKGSLCHIKNNVLMNLIQQDVLL